MIAGYERPFQVRAMLEALARERRGHIRDPRHLASIEAQEAIYQAELDRMVAEGVPDEEVTTNKAMGTLSYVGIPGKDRGRLIG
jgi:hypothetical protein